LVELDLETFEAGGQGDRATLIGDSEPVKVHRIRPERGLGRLGRESLVELVRGREPPIVESIEDERIAAFRGESPGQQGRLADAATLAERLAMYTSFPV
jgi:hypothetical protein